MFQIATNEIINYMLNFYPVLNGFTEETLGRKCVTVIIECFYFCFSFFFWRGNVGRQLECMYLYPICMYKLDIHSLSLLFCITLFCWFTEMRPMWYSNDDIPFKDMWPDDILWFPLLLQNKTFYGYFKFQGMDNIVDYKLEEVDDINKVSIPPGPQPTCG